MKTPNADAQNTNDTKDFQPTANVPSAFRTRAEDYGDELPDIPAGGSEDRYADNAFN